MRLLISCQSCKRQYDATGKKPGSRFRCLCGATVTVQEPQGHDAAVVRCSSCGAPREESAAACPHCHSDFTLFEKDRDTVCPSCLTRVSDRARFCHHCGVPLNPEHDAGKQTKFTCPVCERDLHSRQLGQERISVLECGGCAGLWLGHDAVRVLTERAAREKTPQLVRGQRPPRKPPKGPRYRRCVVCRQLMPQTNYGSGDRSGVIIDLCRDHGVWFDADELQRVLDWIRTGGAPRELPQTAPKKEPRELSPEVRALLDEQRRPETLVDALDEFANSVLGRLFRFR